MKWRAALLGAALVAALGGWSHGAQAGVIECVAPPTPGNPEPSNGAVDVPLDAALYWTGGNLKSGAKAAPAAKAEAGTRAYPAGVDPSDIPGGIAQKGGSPVTLPFFDNMEGGANGWTTDGFWHQISNPEQLAISAEINPRLVHLPDVAGQLPSAFSGSTAWWYGENATGTFIGNDFFRGQVDGSGGESTASNSGSLQSPPIDLTSVSDATLTFKTWWEIEGVDVNTFDLMLVEYSVDGGQSFNALGSGLINPANDVDGEPWKPFSSGGLGEVGQWITVQFDLSGLAGQVATLRFRFATIDALYNGFRGWFIDDVSITAAGTPAPNISGVAPDTGRQGTLASVLGANFVNGGTVTVGGLDAAAVVVSNTESQITIPGLSPGTYDVTLTNPDGQSDTLENAYTVVNTPAPSVDAITPSSGPEDQATSVTITGSNFNPGATADVGGTPLNNVVIFNSGTITAEVPSGLPVGFQNVTVTNPDGQSGKLVGGYQVLASCPVTYDVLLNGQLICDDTSITACTPGFLLPGTTYSWQVIAESGVETAASGVFSFTTVDAGCAAPGAPLNPSPEDNAVNVPTDTLLSWEVPGLKTSKNTGDTPGSAPASKLVAKQNTELFTTTDNQDNAGTGSPDGDMDAYLFKENSIAPIEFDIAWSGGSTPTSAQLLLNVWDVDETDGEVDGVFLNGTRIGTLTGANQEWSTTVLGFSPSLLIQGNNRVRVTIDEETDGEWAVEVDWGQFVLDNTPGGEAFVRNAALDGSEFLPGDTVTAAIEVDTNAATQQVLVETNLIDPNGVNVAGTSTTRNLSGQADDPFSVPLDLPENAIEGAYTYQVLVFDSASALLQDSALLPFTVGACSAVFDVFLNGVRVAAAISAQEIDPGELSPGQVYTWQVVAKNATGTTAGPVWAFTTEDDLPPVITLVGPGTVELSCGTSFQDPGATALDNSDGDLTDDIQVVGNVDEDTPGSYAIEYQVQDSSGNPSTVTRTVVVVDNLPPVLTLNGSPSLSLTVGAVFADPGATAQDACEGSLTDQIIVGGDTVSTGAPGVFTITYTVEDGEGNQAQVSRQVEILPSSPPVITVFGSSTVTVECGGFFQPAEFSAFDDVDGDVTDDVEVTGLPNVDSVGTYIVRYNVSDSEGNPASEVIRTVTVKDTLKPTIELQGSQTVVLQCGQSFFDPGVIAFDDCDNVLTDSVVAGGDTVDLAKAGTYTIVYRVADSSGNKATPVNRTVVVPECEGNIGGRVRNSLTGKPVEGVTVEFAAALQKGLGITTTDAFGDYFFSDAQFPVLNNPTFVADITFARKEYFPEVLEDIPAGDEAADVLLVPLGITVPGIPGAISGPKSIRVSWPPNPEYNVRGYNVYRTETDANGSPRGSAVKINGNPNDVYDAIISGTEYVDPTVIAQRYYVYQVQAISGADRPSELSAPSSPPAKGQFLTVFFTDVDVETPGVYLWEVSPGIERPTIPISARSVYEVDATSMNIVARLPKAYIQKDLFVANRDILPTGITAGMLTSASLRSNDDDPLIPVDQLELRIAASSINARSLFGSGALFHLAFSPETASGCGDTILIPDNPPLQDGVRFFDDPFSPPLMLDLENGILCNAGGCIPGDANSDGAVNQLDAKFINDFFVKVENSRECTLVSGDINQDKRVDSADATLVLRWLSGLNIHPPVNTKAADLSDISFAAAGAVKSDSGPVIEIPAIVAQPGDVVSMEVEIANGAPTAGFNALIGFPAGPGGLVLEGVELGKALSSKGGELSESINEGAEGDKGFVRISVSAPENIGAVKGGSTSLVVLNFRVPEASAGTVLPVNINGFSLNDPFGFVPAFESPQSPNTINGKIIVGEGTPVGAEEAEQALDAFADSDGDSNGELTAEEALNGPAAISAEVFAVLDIDGDEKLTVAELRQLAAQSPVHAADLNGDKSVNLGELLRLIQLYNAGAFQCSEEFGEDGYEIGDGGEDCALHSADFDDNWTISLSELLRVIQLRALGAYVPCEESDDGYCSE